MASVVRQLNMDDIPDDIQQETDGVRVVGVGQTDNVTIRNGVNVERLHYNDVRDGREIDYERTNRRARHRSYRSQIHLLNTMRQELKEMREMIQRIPGVLMPLENATSTSYAYSPFTDDITLIDIPKWSSIRNIKMYEG